MSKILVADDDKIMLSLLTTLLELEGDEAITLTRPEEIVSTVRREHPDLILMDFHLSGGDSCTALRQLKQDPVLHTIPILITSGMDHRTECLEAGADDFILKPFRPNELIAHIRAALAPQPEQ